MREDHNGAPFQFAGAGEETARGGDWRLWLVVSGVVIVLDQLSKFAINHRLAYGESHEVASFFNLILAHNRGAAFSLLDAAGGWQRWLFAAIAVAASAWVVHLLRRHREQKLFCLALALIMGGALGNLIDRIAYGYVVDFLDFHWDERHFAAFNVADSAITGGAGLLLLESYLNFRRERAAHKKSSGD